MCASAATPARLLCHLQRKDLGASRLDHKRFTTSPDGRASVDVPEVPRIGDKVAASPTCLVALRYFNH